MAKRSHQSLKQQLLAQVEIVSGWKK